VNPHRRKCWWVRRLHRPWESSRNRALEDTTLRKCLLVAGCARAALHLDAEQSIEAPGPISIPKVTTSRTVNFQIEIGPGASIDLFGVQVEAQPGASGYKKTFSKCRCLSQSAISGRLPGDDSRRTRPAFLPDEDSLTRIGLKPCPRSFNTKSRPRPRRRYCCRLHIAQRRGGSAGGTHALAVDAAAYAPRVLRHNLFEMQTASNLGVDTIPKCRLRWRTWIHISLRLRRSVGWKGQCNHPVPVLQAEEGAPETETLILFKVWLIARRNHRVHIPAYRMNG